MIRPMFHWVFYGGSPMLRCFALREMKATMFFSWSAVHWGTTIENLRIIGWFIGRGSLGAHQGQLGQQTHPTPKTACEVHCML